LSDKTDHEFLNRILQRGLWSFETIQGDKTFKKGAKK